MIDQPLRQADGTWSIRARGLPCAGHRYQAKTAGVFNTGTMRWVRSLSGGHIGFGINARTQRFNRQVTANVLRAFADGPAAAKYPARDNLQKMHEWAGDPIAAHHNLW